MPSSSSCIFGQPEPIAKSIWQNKKKIAKSINQEQESCVAKGIKLRSIRNKEDYQILNYQNKIIN